MDSWAQCGEYIDYWWFGYVHVTITKGSAMDTRLALYAFVLFLELAWLKEGNC